MPRPRSASTTPSPFATLKRRQAYRTIRVPADYDPAVYHWAPILYRLLMIADDREACKELRWHRRLPALVLGLGRRRGRPKGSPNKPKPEDWYPVLAVLCGVKKADVLRHLAKGKDGVLLGTTSNGYRILNRLLEQLGPEAQRDCPDIIEAGKGMDPRKRLAFIKRLADLVAAKSPA